MLASSSPISHAPGVVIFASRRVRPSSISTVPIIPHRLFCFASRWRIR
jgi:hypothetical protein